MPSGTSGESVYNPMPNFDPMREDVQEMGQGPGVQEHISYAAAPYFDFLFLGFQLCSWILWRTKQQHMRRPRRSWRRPRRTKLGAASSIS